MPRLVKAHNLNMPSVAYVNPCKSARIIQLPVFLTRLAFSCVELGKTYLSHLNQRPCSVWCPLSIPCTWAAFPQHSLR